MVPGGKSGCGASLSMLLALVTGVLGAFLYLSPATSSSSAVPVVVSAVPVPASYVDSNNIPTLGSPDAPIHFIEVADFSCPHCQDYFKTDMERFRTDYVLTGKATVGVALMTFVGGDYSALAAEAAMCANDQGAFFPMEKELYHLADTMGAPQAFTLDQVIPAAQTLGLDTAKLQDCISSNRYSSQLATYAQFAQDHGVTGVPTILVSYGNSGDWSEVPRDYDSLKNLTEAAQTGGK